MPYVSCMQPDLVQPSRRNTDGNQTESLLQMRQVCKYLQMRREGLATLKYNARQVDLDVPKLNPALDLTPL